MTSQQSSRRPWRRNAVALAASTFLLAMTGMSAVHAQSNTTGTIYGQAPAGTGYTILVEDVSTGLKRTVTPDASGRFNAVSLPTGTYKATLLRDGKVVSTTTGLEVLIGQGAEAVFSDGVQVVQITGRLLRLDMSASNNGATYTSKTLDSLPIARNLAAIIQLAPNTTNADPRYQGGASFGGGAPSENSYYINGFPVTNPLTQLGSSELPFGAIGQAQVLTGGFGAEFGRSIGGVVNLTTKSGSNSWEGGFSASVTPSAMRSKYKDILYPTTGTSTNSGTDATIFLRNDIRKVNESSLGAYIGGPLMQDKLFGFVAVERLKRKDARMGAASSTFTAGFSNGGWAERDNTTDRYLAKFNWNIATDHLLELTLLGDKYSQDETLSGFNYLTGARDGIVKQKATFVNSDQQASQLGIGASSQILRYTGQLTSDLTVTALYGESTSKHENTYSGVDVFSNLRQVRADPSTRFPGFTYGIPYAFPGGTTVLAPGSEDKVKSTRLDFEYSLGNHSLRGGIDDVKLKSTNAGVTTAGGGLYRYFSTVNPTLKPNNATTAVGAGTGVLTQPAPTTADPARLRYYYGYEQIFTTTTNADSNQAALYLEDKWQITKGLLITPGVRVEKYENLNGDREVFLKVKTQIHPRFSFSWDVLDDKSTKLYGSAGRYGVQIPTHLAVRGASRSTFTRHPFVYTGVDPVTGVPIGRFNLGTAFSSNNEYNQAKDAKTVAAVNLKPNSQDELTLGIERALVKDVNVSARVTYRKLVATIDDLCDPRPFNKYAADRGISTTNYAGFGCASFNPGQGNTFLVDYAGTGKDYTRVNFSAAELGFEKAKRTYFALDFFAEHQLSDGWYGKVTYTYSKSKGNTEGQTLSDVAQTDVAATQTWDHPELMVGAYGYLPNDRRHQIKAYGFYRLLPEVDVGANLLLASGRPKNCIGNFVGLDASDNPKPGSGTPSFGTSAADFDHEVSYGSAYRRCSFDGGATLTATPRGSEGTLPWDTRLDMNVVYKPAAFKGLSLRADVFNAFNRQTIQAIDEVHENASDPGTVTPTYGRVIGYTAPRSVKFTVTYDMKF